MTSRLEPPRASLIRLESRNDPRGSLRVGEYPGAIPFCPTRFFLVSDVPTGGIRGDHAHRECHQFLVCVTGAIDVEIRDTAATSHRIELRTADVGLHIPPLVWAKQHYLEPGSQLLVLASHPYSAAEYLTDFDEYIRLRG